MEHKFVQKYCWKWHFINLGKKAASFVNSCLGLNSKCGKCDIINKIKSNSALTKMQLKQNTIDKRISTAPTRETLVGLKLKNGSVSSQNSKICRICLGEQTKNQPCLKFCKCLGSLEFMHESCLLSWANRMIKRRIQMKEQFDTIHCEICQETLKIQQGKRLKCRNRNIVKALIQEHKQYLLACIVFILLTLGFMCFLIFVGTDGKYLLEGIPDYVVLNVAWAILTLHLLFWVYKFLQVFVVYFQTYGKKIVPLIVSAPHPEPMCSDVKLSNEPLMDASQTQKTILENNKNQENQKSKI